MSALSKIRENVGLVIILIAISLAAFILTDLFTGLGGVSVDTTAGEVAGTDIDIQVLTNKSQEYRDRVANDPNVQEFQIDMQAWSDLVRDIIYDNEWGDLGMFMSDEEINMLYYGPIVHPYLLNDPTFRDSTGRYSPAIVQSILQQVENLATDPNASPQQRSFRSQFLEQRRVISLDRLQTKWRNMIEAGQFVSVPAVKRDNAAQGRTVDFSYVQVPYATVPADQAVVTDEDYQNFYEEHKNRFKTNGPVVRIKYTYFPLSPSQKDKQNLVKEMQSNYLTQFGKVANAFDYANSATNVRGMLQDTSYKSMTALPAPLQGVSSVDTVVGPIDTEYGLGIYRVTGMKEDSNYAVKARHILVRIDPANPGQPLTAEDTANARREAYDIRAQLNADPSQFDQLVLDKSDDGFTKATGGSLGWIDPKSVTYGGDFGDVVGKASQGSFVVAESNSGYHVVQVEDRSNKLFQYAELGRDIKVSSATRDSVYKRAGQYAGQAKAGIAFDSLMKDFGEANTGLSPFISADVFQIQGEELEKPREMIAWAFQSESGDLSSRIFDVGNAFVVAKVRAKSEGDYLPMDAVKDQIATEVQNEKKAQVILGKLGGGSDLAQIAQAYGPGASTGSATQVNFASNSAGPLGMEPKVVGRAHGMAQGEISAPIEGSSGVYIIKVDGVTEATEMMETMVQFQIQAQEASKGQAAFGQAQQALYDLAKIKDYRYQFDYREDSGRR